jgi:energy-coupling factor transporter ATP-binding protein EcfA2
MRLRRLVLTDVAGVTSAVLDVAEHGVSVIAAPNESGKSTLLRAYLLLLSKTGHRGKTADVRSLQPVGRDVGSRVQAELVLGGVTFEVDRIYNSGAKSSLTVRGRTTETLTGKEADDLLRARFLEAVDQDLYELLVFEQGRALDAPHAGRSAALIGALQAADTADGPAGSAQGGDELLTGLRKIVASSFHKAHRTPIGDLRRLRLEVEGAKDRLLELEAQIEQQEHGGSTGADDLAVRLARAQGALVTADQQIERARAFVRVADARRVLQASAAQLKVRTDAREALEVLAAQEKELLDAAATARDGLLALEKELKAAQADAAKAAKAHEALARAVAQGESDLLAALKARADELAALIKQEKVTDAAVSEAQKVERAVEVADAAVGAGSWEIRVTAGRALELEIDGETVAVKKGGAHRQQVSGSISLTEEDGTQIAVLADAKRRKQIDQLTSARDELSKLLKKYGADDVAALQDLAERRAALEEERDELLGRHEELQDESSSAALPSPRVKPGASIDDLEAALEQAITALEAEDDAAARVLIAQLEARTDQAKALIEQQSNEATRATERREQAEAALASARAEHSDADLEQQWTKAQKDLEALASDGDEPLATEPELQEQRKRILEEIEQLNRAVGAAEGRGASRAALEATRENLAENHALLEARFDRDLREAEAAATLLDRLEAARAAQGERYREPLEQRVGELLTRLYSYGCRVELNDDLRIVRRSEPDGRMVEWEQLSGGAREQAAVVTGLAMAELAGEDGVPFWIDDSIVYTDDSRVEGLKELLAETSAQVIILTCRQELAQGLPAAAYSFER